MTADEPRIRVTTNLAFGICLILLGTALILDRLQLVPASQLLRFWPVALVLFGAALVMQSFQRVDPATAQEREGARLLHVIASVILGVFAWNAVSEVSERTTLRTDTNNNVEIVAVLGRHHRVVNAAAFRGGQMTSIWGRSDLDLRNATLAPGEDAVIEVFTLMGGATIHVPDGWTVDVRATPIMGGVKDRRGDAREIAGAPRLVVRGFIMMGGMTIRS
jgi:predicted membrane protein